jgi:hypothetical protein
LEIVVQDWEAFHGFRRDTKATLDRIDRVLEQKQQEFQEFRLQTAATHERCDRMLDYLLDSLMQQRNGHG